MGQTLTIWTIRCSLAVYLVCTGRELLSGQPTASRGDRYWRWLWLGGALVCAAHISLAFVYYHELSHERAVQETARETEELLGVAFGGGVYFNYLFLLLWLSDAIWRLALPASYDQRPMWLHGLLHTYLFFIVFNGVVVFETGSVRAAGVVGAICLAALGWPRFRRLRPSAKPRLEH